MDRQRNHTVAMVFGALGFLVVTYMTSLHNYLLFHALVEGLSIFISFTVFAIAWNSRSYHHDSTLQIIGIAYLFIGFLDFMHTLAYKGMSIFTSYDFYANQLWIAARFFESTVLVMGLHYAGRKRMISPSVLMGIYSVVTIGFMVSIFATDLFPICYIEGEGQTSFKLFSEYLIIGILGWALILLYKKKRMFEGHIYHLLQGSIVLTMLSELAFTFYISNYGFSNLVGHYLKILSFYLIYQAIVVTGIRQPYRLIFKELTEANEEMKRLNGQLEKSAQESYEANQSKSQYLSVITHEMRTPLNGILGFSQMLRRSEPSAEQIAYIEEIIRSANTLRQSIDNILDMEKFRSNKMHYSEEEILLQSFFEDRLMLYQVLSEDKGLTLESIIDIPEGIRVRVDSGKLEQLFNNLISNAVKFTEKGSISFNISGQLYDDQLRLKYKVTDTGSGIADADQELLFKPFVQVGHKTKTKYGGSGLGLSICKEIVTYYNGSIQVHSRKGHGSVFEGEIVLKTTVQ